MQSVHQYFNVVKMNEEDTRVVPGDTFNFHVKVLYHSVEAHPEVLLHQLAPSSILSNDFFREGEGKNFLRSLLSTSQFYIEESLEHTTQGVTSIIRELYEVASMSDFLSQESPTRSSESQNRVIPLLLTIIILNYGERDRDDSRRSQRQNSRRSQRQSSRLSLRQSSRMNRHRQSSRMNRTTQEAIINTFLEKCTSKIGSEDCCICLEELNTVNAECSTMPCQHAFHLPCIITWLKTNHVCPLCRYSLPILAN